MKTQCSKNVCNFAEITINRQQQMNCFNENSILDHNKHNKIIPKQNDSAIKCGKNTFVLLASNPSRIMKFRIVMFWLTFFVIVSQLINTNKPAFIFHESWIGNHYAPISWISRLMLVQTFYLWLYCAGAVKWW